MLLVSLIVTIGLIRSSILVLCFSTLYWIMVVMEYIIISNNGFCDDCCLIMFIGYYRLWLLELWLFIGAIDGYAFSSNSLWWLIISIRVFIIRLI